MAKDGTMRGGQQIGSGRKSKALTEKIGSGLAATVIDLPEPEDIAGGGYAAGEGFRACEEASDMELVRTR